MDRWMHACMYEWMDWMHAYTYMNAWVDAYMCMHPNLPERLPLHSSHLAIKATTIPSQQNILSLIVLSTAATSLLEALLFTPKGGCCRQIDCTCITDALTEHIICNSYIALQQNYWYKDIQNLYTGLSNSNVCIQKDTRISPVETSLWYTFSPSFSRHITTPIFSGWRNNHVL